MIKNNMTFELDGTRVLKVYTQDVMLDFTDPTKLHPVQLDVTGNAIRITNMYALDQCFEVGFQDGLINMLFDYIQAPALVFRKIHNLASEQSIIKMRNVIATYSLHLSRYDKQEIRVKLTRYLRALAVIGNKQLADDLEAAINDKVNEFKAFFDIMRGLMKSEAYLKNYIKMLEIYFGYVKRDLLTVEMLEDIPLERLDTREVSSAVATWAYDNGLIVAEQINEARS